MRLLPFLALLLLVACNSANFPQTACASNPALTTKAQIDACRAAALAKELDAGPDVMHAVVVTSPKDGGRHE